MPVQENENKKKKRRRKRRKKNKSTEGDTDRPATDEGGPIIIQNGRTSDQQRQQQLQQQQQQQGQQQQQQQQQHYQQQEHQQQQVQQLQQQRSKKKKKRRRKKRGRLERCFGFFRCRDCKTQWTSAWVWRIKDTPKVVFRQQCQRCRLFWFPWRTRYLRCSHCGQETPDCTCPRPARGARSKDKKPHRSDLCEKCLGGNPCTNEGSECDLEERDYSGDSGDD